MTMTIPSGPLLEAGWPERWAAVKKASASDAIAGWASDSKDGRRTTGPDPSICLRIAPQGPICVGSAIGISSQKQSDWEALAAGQKPTAPRPELITDFCGYNAFSSPHIPSEDPGLYWVGDLTVNCHVDVKEHQPGGEVVLELK